MTLKGVIIMKKSKLLVLPLVMIMTGCNKPAAQPTAELPSGGEEVAYSKDDQEKQAAYSNALTRAAQGALNTVNQTKIQIDATAKASVNNVPVTESVKSNINAEASVSIYLATATQSEGAYLKLEVKNVTASATNMLPGEKEGEYKDFSISGLKFTVDIVDEADGFTRAYIDLSDRSIENALTPFFGESTSLMLNSLLGANRKVKADLSTMAGEYLPLIMGGGDDAAYYYLGDDTADEEEYEAEPIPNLLSTGLAYLQMMVGGLIGEISADLSGIDEALLPTVKEYKNAAGEVERIGLQTNLDLVEIINSFDNSDQATTLRAVDAADEAKEALERGRISAALLVGKTKGSEGFAFEEANAYVDVAVQGGISANAEASVSAKYNNQVTLTKLTDAQKANYNKDLSEILSSIGGLLIA